MYSLSFLAVLALAAIIPAHGIVVQVNSSDGAGARPLTGATSISSPDNAAGGLVAVAAFGGGGVYRTTDRWATYTQVLAANVMRLSFPSASVGFAAGDAVYRTVDGGATWTKVFSTPNTTFYAVAACTDTHAFVSGVQHNQSVFSQPYIGVTASTSDGVTWVQSFNALSTFIDLAPTDNDRMSISGVSMYLVKDKTNPVASVLMSNDCGIHWSELFNFSRPTPPNLFLQLPFDLSGFWRSPDEGILTGWFREVEIPNAAPAGSCSLFDSAPQATTPLHAAVPFSPGANKTTASGALLFSGSGGSSLTLVQPPTQPATLTTTCGTTLYGGAFVSCTNTTNATIFVVGGSILPASPANPAGFALRSNDRGLTWSSVMTTDASDLRRISFGPSGKHGCTVGIRLGSKRYASVGCTTTGGDSWTMVDAEFAFPKPTVAVLWEDTDVVVLS